MPRGGWGIFLLVWYLILFWILLPDPAPEKDEKRNHRKHRPGEPYPEQLGTNILPTYVPAGLGGSTYTPHVPVGLGPGETKIGKTKTKLNLNLISIVP